MAESKLTKADAQSIVIEFAAGARLVDLAAKHRCHRRTIQSVIHGRSWADIDRSALVGLDPNAHRARGTKVNTSKLSEVQVAEIFASPDSQPRLGRQYGVSANAIQKIKARTSWKHLSGQLQGGSEQ